jgi:NAD(P)H-dependent flavin oxidoreductase YrpB (nitropropane dioxygenase family)
MLKTRITEQYGLRVPFINAGMAFIATPPLVRAVCSAGGMGILGSAAMPPTCFKRLSVTSRRRIRQLMESGGFCEVARHRRRQALEARPH